MGKVKNALDNIAERITDAHQAAEHGMASRVRHAIRAGKYLCEAKETVPRGEWGTWPSKYFKPSVRPGQVYIRSAEERAQRGSISVRPASETKLRQSSTPTGRLVRILRQLGTRLRTIRVGGRRFTW